MYFLSFKHIIQNGCFNNDIVYHYSIPLWQIRMLDHPVYTDLCCTSSDPVQVPDTDCLPGPQ